MHVYDPLLRSGLALLASLSPLLTFGHLWQLKEWRIDRLREHLARERWIRPLFGITRPLLLIASAPLLLWHDVPLLVWCLGFCGLGALLSLVQLALRRQPLPVWTHKAIVLMATALAIDLAFLLMMTNDPWSSVNIAVVVLVFAQPLVLMTSAALFSPIDRYLKGNIIARAKAIRAAHPELKVIGVTGSVGKTTTKEILSHVLQPLGAKATPAHLNAEIGVAQWLATILEKEPPPILVVEMGAYRRGEIALLADIAQPTMGVVTAVGNQHVALFGSQENIFLAKSELVEAIPPNGKAFLNGDDALCRKMKERCRCPGVIVSTGGPSDMEATDIEETPEGLRFRVGQTAFSAKLRGTHNVRNLLLAIAVCRELGMTDDAIAARMRTFEPPSKTFQVRREAGVELLDDTYNSSPESFKAAIAWAKSQPFDQKTLLAAGIIELGEEFEDVHRELGAQAQPVFQRVIFLDEDAGTCFAQGFGRPVEVPSKTSAPVPAGSLLVCIGRMSPGTIRRFLPATP